MAKAKKAKTEKTREDKLKKAVKLLHKAADLVEEFAPTRASIILDSAAAISEELQPSSMMFDMVVEVETDDNSYYYVIGLEMLEEILELPAKDIPMYLYKNAEQTRIGSAQDVDLWFDNTGNDPDWWKNEGKQEWAEYLSENC